MILCALALGACASHQEGALTSGDSSAQQQIVRIQGDRLPSPDRADFSSSAEPYLLGPFDEVAISVYGIEELNLRDVQVDASGRLSFPLVGTIEASGKTPDEVAALLREGLKNQFVRDPRVTVNLIKMVSQTVTVEGEVKKPGIYPVVGRMSLLRSIAAAEGLTEFSNRRNVVILREVAGKNYAALYNLRAIRSGTYEDPQVFHGDVVMVDESRGRRIFKDFLQLAPLLSAPLIVALQR